jgi:hypothetical protein
LGWPGVPCLFHSIDVFTFYVVCRTSDFGCDSAALHELFTVTLDRLAKLGKEADEKIASMEDENSRISANRKKEIDRHHRSLQGVRTLCVRGGNEGLRMQQCLFQGGGGILTHFRQISFTPTVSFVKFSLGRFEGLTKLSRMPLTAGARDDRGY